MKKVVYLALFPLTAAIERYLFVRDVLEAGFETEYWDLSAIYYQDISFQNVSTQDCVRNIKSLAEVKKRIRKEDLNKTVFIAQMDFNWQTLSLFYLLTRFKCKMACFPLSVLPSEGIVQKGLEKIRGSIFSTAFWQGLLNLFTKVCRRVGIIKQYDIIFASGSLTREGYGKYSKVVNINYMDYDRYILLRNSELRLVQGKYCVFLDEGAIANEDNKILNNKLLDAAAYYGALHRFFDHIEKKFDVKVVIAAHPGIKYSKEVFRGREIHEGKTCELVKDCDFVIGQSSMSVSYAVLYSKPVIFIYTDEYIKKRPINWQVLQFHADLLRCGVVDISGADVDSINKIMPIDPVAYEDYKYTNLSSKESEAKSSKEIVIQEFANLK